MSSISERIDRAIRAMSEWSATRRAAVLGIAFGLLLCVVVLGICGVLSFVAQLGNGG